MPMLFYYFFIKYNLLPFFISKREIKPFFWELKKLLMLLPFFTKKYTFRLFILGKVIKRKS